MAKKHEKTFAAFITGASRGVGYSIARCVAPMCSHLLVASRRKAYITDAARRLSEETGCRVHATWGDLAKGRLFAEKAKQLVTTTTNQVDLLVLNAGYYEEGSLAEIADADFERNMLVNFHSAHYVVSALLPFLEKSPVAKIVIIGSTAAYEAAPVLPTYGIAKWGLRGYAINLRKELMSQNIGVTFIAPGPILTDMWEGEHVPADRLLAADDIGKLVAAIMTLSPQAVVEELVVRPMLGDLHV